MVVYIVRHVDTISLGLLRKWIFDYIYIYYLEFGESNGVPRNNKNGYHSNFMDVSKKKIMKKVCDSSSSK